MPGRSIKLVVINYLYRCRRDKIQSVSKNPKGSESGITIINHLPPKSHSDPAKSQPLQVRRGEGKRGEYRRKHGREGAEGGFGGWSLRRSGGLEENMG